MTAAATAKPSTAVIPAWRTAESRPSVIPDDMTGEIVYWWNKGITSNTPLPAIVVLDHGQGNLCLKIFARDGDSTLDGVKHRDDVNLKPAHKLRSGCWCERR
jgi:hypothetical protein